MNYIFTMSLSGSCLYVLYKIFRSCAGNRLSEKWYYSLLRIAALYFIIPLPWLKDLYISIAKMISAHGKYTETMYYAKDQLVLYIGRNGWMLNDTARLQGTIFAIWLCGIAVAGILLYVYYLRRKKALLRIHITELTPAEKQEAGRILLEQRIHFPVQFRRCEEGGSPFTIGILRPVVFLGESGTSDKRNLMLRHELIHIKRRDMIWRIFSMMIVVMHWYNPLVWMFKRDLEMVCESSCDERVLSGHREKVRAQYADLLLSYATDEKRTFFGMNLSKNGRELHMRIRSFLNRRKKLSEAAGILLVIALVLLDSTTVFAYKGVMVWDDREAVLDASWLDSESAWVPSGQEPIWYIPEAQFEYVKYYDDQFVDKYGKVYPAKEESVGKGTCEHHYIDGIQQQHTALEDGHCKIIYRNALRCEKCGKMKEFSLNTVAICGECCQAE